MKILQRRKSKNTVSRAKLILAAVLGTAMAGSLTAGVATLPVNAMNTSSATVSVAELYNSTTGTFNQTAVSDLLLKMTGQSTYDAALTYLNSQADTAITSSAINARNGSKDIVVTFGGFKWTVTYVSKDMNGNMIATLWYAGAESSAVFNDFSSATTIGGYDGYKYSNHYGASRIRAITLGNGGSYYSSTVTGAVDSNVTTKVATTTEMQTSSFYKFAQGELSDFLVAPNFVSWQQDQYAIHAMRPQRMPNNSLIYAEDNWIFEYLKKAQIDPLYFQWGTDKVWLPSLSETGGYTSTSAYNVNGIWDVSVNQRSCAQSGTSLAYAWTRTGGYQSTFDAYVLGSNGVYKSGGDATNLSYGVRPAVHLNLTKAAEYGVNDNTNLQNLWNAAVQQSKDSGTQVTFTLPYNWYANTDTTYTKSFGEGIGFDSGRLYIPEGANIVLDLNGYTIDRGLVTVVATTGNVITVNGGTLVIEDSSTKQTGSITGGYGSGQTDDCGGGGVWLTEGSSLTLNGGGIVGNKGEKAGGVKAYEDSTFVMNGGRISNNVSYGSFGGGIWVYKGTATINGGEISGNKAASNGGGIHLNDSYVEINGGSIINNKAGSAGGGINIGTSNTGDPTLVINDCLISGNQAGTNGGGINLGGSATTKSSATLNGGEIINNGVITNGGGVYVNYGNLVVNDCVIGYNRATRGGGMYVSTNGDELTINGGKVTGNSTSAAGAGLYLNNYTKLTITGGEISYNTTAASGGGLQINGGSRGEMTGGSIINNTAVSVGAINIYANSIGDVSFTMSGGTISGNTAENGRSGAILVGTSTTFNFNGGTITNNTATTNGGGVYVDSTGTMSVGGGKIYDNSVNGVQDNVYLVSGRTISVTDNLVSKGESSYIGVTMAANTGTFTSGYNTKNSAYDPSTFFFADNIAYMVSKTTASEGQLVAVSTSVTQVSLIWQYSSDNTNWKNAESPYDYIMYSGSEYWVRALNGTNIVSAFNSATSYSGTSSTVQNVGSYTFLVNNSSTTVKYTNPTLTLEVIPVEIVWQYSVDNGHTWAELQETTVTYAGLSYSFRAVNSYSGAVVQTMSGYAKEAKEYTFEISNTSGIYSNATLNFTILKSVISVDWNFTSATIDDDGYYIWNYDGIAHSPVAVLRDISNEQVGNLPRLLNYVTEGGSSGGTTTVPKNAGTYTVTVYLLDNNGSLLSDDSIALINQTVTFKISPKTLTLEWYDESGEAVTEATYDYNGAEREVTAKLTGVIPGESVTPTITYDMVGGTITGNPVNHGTYTAHATQLDNGNYVLDKAYSCQIDINSIAVTVEWSGNAGDDGAFSWVFSGKDEDNNGLCAPEPELIGLVTGENPNKTIEYAMYSGGVAGVYSTDVPVNAGTYIARVTISDAHGNYTVSGNTQQFEITKLGVEVLWKDANGNDVDVNEDGEIVWTFDGLAHNITPYFDEIVVYKDGMLMDAALTAHRNDMDAANSANGALTNVGNATAVAELDNDDEFFKNFEIIKGGSQSYRVVKKVLSATDVIWTDTFGGEYKTGETPTYDFGTISGTAGPGFIAKTAGANSYIITLTVTYSAGTAYSTQNWPVDNVNGYTATATLNAADFTNYEFEGGKDTTTLTFFIRAVNGSKEHIDVTWVVFTGANTYVDANTYSFTYNGNAQFPEPIYVHDGNYEKLTMSDTGKGTDAGTYTVRLALSDVYDYSASDYSYTYTIKPMGVAITWSKTNGSSSTVFTYDYDGKTHVPYAAVNGISLPCPVTVTGEETNAGTYTATAEVGSNFVITSNATQEFTISKLKISYTLVHFDYGTGAHSDGNYWIYDGELHAPTASVDVTSLGMHVDLIVMGAARTIGTHTVYAILDSTNPDHSNFEIVGEAKSTFEIVEVTIHSVIWKDKEGNESVNGNTLLTFVYNGMPQNPDAYYLDDDLNEVPLTVAGAMTDAGKYIAYITDNFDYAGGKIPECVFEIVALEVEVKWSDTEKTYNGLEQYPTATLLDANGNSFVSLEGYPLRAGTDYEIVGFTVAGSYTAEIRFLNKNYTYKSGTNTTPFVINKLDLNAEDLASDVTLTWNYLDAVGNDTDGYYWMFDDAPHAPTLTLTYRLNGKIVAFTFSYSGVATSVGTHTVIAAIASAKVTDASGEIYITDNLLFTAQKVYEIKPFEITVNWSFTGAVQDGGNWYYTFSGSTFTPAATYTDWNSQPQSFDYVYGGAVNASENAYTAKVVAPANCVFATGETGTHEFYIKRADITVKWVFDSDAISDGNGGYYWIFDGNAHSPVPYIDGTNYELPYSGLQINAGAYDATAAQSDGNYTIQANEKCHFVIVEKDVYIKWFGKDGGVADDDFVWTYDNNAHAPTAKLVDVNGNAINDLNGDPISVSVTGAMTIVGPHTATAVDTFTNYKFASNAKTEQQFTIVTKSVTEVGFKWVADGAVKSNDGTYDVYTYQYSGGAITPVPYTLNDLVFSTEIYTYKNGNKDVAVTTIKEVGDYIISITPINSNYSVPAELATIRVTVTEHIAKVVWSTDKLVYNGTAQAPTAYYVDANGNHIALEVTVNGDHVNAGKGYQATAAFKGDDHPTNYVLTDYTTTFDIEQLEIPVNWLWSGTWTDKSVTYDGDHHTPIPEIDDSVILNADKSKLRFVYEVTKSGVLVITSGTVKDAGTYTVTLKISGDAAANYKFAEGVAVEKFTIEQKELTVTIASASVTYGQNAPAFVPTFSGFVDGESETSPVDVIAVQASWLKCNYTNRSEPGDYTIGVVVTELQRLLPNYAITTEDGTLKVNPASGIVIWRGGDAGDLNNYYSGSEYKPYAYYYEGDDFNNPIELKVVYATYDDSTDTYTEITDETYKAVDAGQYYVLAKPANGNVQLERTGVGFKILKRTIVVNIDSKTTKYGEPYKTLTWSYASTSLLPLDGDDLNITLSCDMDSVADVNGYKPVGVYKITATWDSVTFGNNYEVTFSGEGDDATTGANSIGIYTITNAEIRVTKVSEVYGDEEFDSIREYDPYQALYIKLSNKVTDTDGIEQYAFIEYSGNLYADRVTVYYSRLFAIDDAPDPHDGVTNDNVITGAGTNQYQTYSPSITRTGSYAVNYIIKIDNHETLYGTWTVLIVPESQIVRIEFVQDYEIEYGEEVPSNLAELLLRGGYINILNNAISQDRFLQYATATVSNGRGGYVNTTTGVGKYTVLISIENTDNNTELVVTYHNDYGNEDTNVGRYSIVPRKLTVEWGTTDFTYDGKIQLPAPTVAGWVTADILTLEDIKTKTSGEEYEYTAYTVEDNGVEITILVSAKGDFKSIGGHTLIVTVEDGNYTIDLLNGNATISISGEEITVIDSGLPEWLIYVLIAAGVLLVILILIIVIVVKKKRAALEDNEGFYDDTDEFMSNDNAETDAETDNYQDDE